MHERQRHPEPAEEFELLLVRPHVESPAGRRRTHRLGMPTAAHVHGTESVAAALDAGFDPLEHVTFMSASGVAADQRLVERIARQGVFVGTTVGLLPAGRPLSPDAAARRGPINRVRSDLYAAGARMTAGSDAGSAPDKPHDVLPYGIAQLTDVIGMTPREALRAATADACQLAARTGRLRPGMDADPLVLGSDPIEDMAALRDVRAVFRAGHRIDRPTLHGHGAEPQP